MEEELSALLCSGGCNVVRVPHLYHLPHRSEIWHAISALPEPIVLACWLNPRPAICLMREYAGREPSHVVDLTESQSASEALASVLEALPGSGDAEGQVRIVEGAISERWYPVIDLSRCTACRHCLQFCLFGVYEIDADGSVIAARPDNCKPGCPACSRICPQGAIIFPLCDDPAIAGAPGTVMKPDAPARRMYYLRTGTHCPACDREAKAGAPPPGADLCPECGSDIDSAEQPADVSPVHQEIDDLIDILDGLADESGGEMR